MADFNSEQPPTVPIPVVMLAAANAGLFVLGGLMHFGVEIARVGEPAAAAGGVLELAAATLLVVAVFGLFGGTPWGRRLVGFANTFAIVVVAAVAMLLGLDDLRSSGFLKSMQVLRVIFAAMSLLMLYHSGRRATLE